MADLGNPFDANSVEPRESFDPLPAGEYQVHIVESEMKPTKAGNGRYLQLTLEVIDGEFMGRKVWDRLNLENPNQTAVDIAQRTLSQICRSCGEMNVRDSEQLHYRRMTAKLKLRAGTAEHDPSNDVSRYDAPKAAQPQAAQPPTGTSPTPF